MAGMSESGFVLLSNGGVQSDGGIQSIRVQCIRKYLFQSSSVGVPTNRATQDANAMLHDYGLEDNDATNTVRATIHPYDHSGAILDLW
jgi:hypothetical protein